MTYGRRLILLFFMLIISVCNVFVMSWMFISIFFNPQRALEIAIAYDRLGNAAMGQGGNETISSWAGRNNHWLEKPINWVFKILTGEDNPCDRWKEK